MSMLLCPYLRAGRYFESLAKMQHPGRLLFVRIYKIKRQENCTKVLIQRWTPLYKSCSPHIHVIINILY